MKAGIRQDSRPVFHTLTVSIDTLKLEMFAKVYESIISEGGIEKSVPRIAVWHHKACRVMTNGDPEGRIFLSYPQTNNGFFILLTTVFIYSFSYLFIYLFFYLFILK